MEGPDWGEVTKCTESTSETGMGLLGAEAGGGEGSLGHPAAPGPWQAAQPSSPSPAPAGPPTRPPYIPAVQQTCLGDTTKAGH